MRRKCSQYNAEYRSRAVDICSESGRPITEVARDLDVEYATLWSWMKKAGKTGRNMVAKESTESAAATGTASAMKVELERLRHELEEVKKERDFLKKAAAFFAQQNK